MSYNGIVFDYYDNGNLKEKDNSGSLTTYTYDYENRLISTDHGLSTTDYSYDPFGKRLSKTAAGITTYYLYDNEDIIVEYDSSGNVVASYLHGQGIDEPVSMTRGGNTYYYSFDGLGSVSELTDASGAVVESYEYDAFGSITIRDTSNQILDTSQFGNSYTYTSRELDAETGLYFYRARYYDPTIGRFLTEDPIGFKGGINFYVYVENNPILFADPYGLWCIPWFAKKTKWTNLSTKNTHYKVFLWASNASPGVTCNWIKYGDVTRVRRVTPREFCCERTCVDGRWDFECGIKEKSSYKIKKLFKDMVLDEDRTTGMQMGGPLGGTGDWAGCENPWTGEVEWFCIGDLCPQRR